MAGECDMRTIHIGIDDTDNETSRGTGYLARQILAECGKRGHKPVSVTRHQFLVDPRIPYTSHNSGACITVEITGDTECLNFVFDFVAERAAEGSDPGVCIMPACDVHVDLQDFGRNATSEILDMDEAFELARIHGLDLRPLGGTGQGIIGALASPALRSTGNDGRFIDMPGLRDLPERVLIADLKKLGIRLLHLQPRQPEEDDEYATGNWIRPRLVAGWPLFPVEWSDEQNAWIPFDRKKSRPLE